MKLTVVKPTSYDDQASRLQAVTSQGFDGIAISPGDAEKELEALDGAAPHLRC